MDAGTADSAVAGVNRAGRSGMITATRLHGPVLAVLGVVGTAACNSDSAPVHTIHTIHTDSAGIPIATAITPLWGPGDGWTVDDDPLLEIGTVNGAPEYQFAEVVAAVRLSTGHIVVADRGASELRGYDAEGRFLWRTGRVGEGPGEFGSLDFVGTMAGDSLVTFDNSLLRVQVLARTVAWRGPSPPRCPSPAGSPPDRFRTRR